MRILTVLIVVGVLASGCSDSTTQSTVAPLPSTTSGAVGGGESSQDSTTSTSADTPDDALLVQVGVVEFIEVLDALLADTSYADAMIDDPEVFVATGRLFCERLDDGDTPIELLTEYIGTIYDGDPDDAPEELLDLSGWLLGTSVGYLCPQHTVLLEEMNT